LRAAEPQVLIAFSSYRERPQQPGVYFYQHDGLGSGKILEGIPQVGKRSDNRASLSVDGRFCAFAAEIENEVSKILLWDRTEKKLVDLPAINDSPNAQLWPALAGDGRSLIFAAWNRPGSSQRWDLFRYDVPGRRLDPQGDANTLTFDERMPAISADGRRLAYVTNEKGNDGLMEIVVADMKSGQRVQLSGLNTAHREVEPALSADGRWLAFSSDRPGGSGARDIYLYDCQEQKLVDLPGLNSVAQEQTPSISPSGRWLAFVSERISGSGERDIWLYDRDRRALVPTPDLNVPQEDIDPCVIEWPK
jgi:Tol biopolymer transport system component